MSFDITAATPVLKQYYTGQKVESLVFKSPTVALMPKDTSGSGEAYYGAIRSSITSAISHTDTVAFTDTSSSVYKRWACPWRSGYGRALVSGEVLDKTGNDKGAFVRAVISETEGAYDGIAAQIGADIWGNGGGAIGRLDSACNVATASITLANPSNAIKVRVGMTLKSASTDGTSGSVRAGSAKVIAVDLFTGVITLDVHMDDGITSPVNSDWIFADGDFGLAFQGIPAWIVKAADRAGILGTSFNGTIRSVDPVRLAGVPYSGGGAPKKESLIQLGMMLHRMGAKTSHIVFNDLDLADVMKDITTNTRIVTETAYKNPQIGFSAVEAAFPFGTVKLMTDPFLAQGDAYMLDMSTWKMPSIGSIPKVDFIDKLNWLRTAGADSYEFRTLYRACTYCSNPGHNGVLTF